jgi:hypothetical protein
MAVAARCAPSAWPDLAGEVVPARTRAPAVAGQLQVVDQGSVAGQRLGRVARPRRVLVLAIDLVLEVSRRRPGAEQLDRARR